MNTQPILSVIIINYNGRRFMKDCLDSLRFELSIPYEVIVVDNASPDNDVPYIRERFPEVTLIASEENLGFAGGNNMGAAKASGQYILLLNNDTVLHSDLKVGIELLQHDETVGIVAAKMLDADGQYRYSAQRFPAFPACLKIGMLSVRKGFFDKGDFPVDKPTSGYPVDMVEGSFMLMRKALWDQLGGMDESIFMYGEDTDFCKQVELAGKRVVYLPSMEYIHFGGFNPEREYLIINGILRYHSRYSPKALYYVIFGTMFIRSLTRWILFTLLYKVKSHKINLKKSRGAFLSLRRSFRIIK